MLSRASHCTFFAMTEVVQILATWFGCGKAPKAPGTFGTLGAIPLAFALSFVGPLPYMLVTLIFSVGAIFVAQLYEGISGRHDDKEVVIDEVAGFLVTMAWVPFTWKYAVAGFLLFRLFDVWKPFPISYVDQKVKGGVGCVGDDLIAGILSNIILQVLLDQRWLA
jgi:phosphatidylglycerophosphatase A